jgi:hypothetical protein
MLTPLDSRGRSARATKVVSDVRNSVRSNFYEPALVNFFPFRRFFPHELSQKFVFVFDPIEKFR